MADISRKRNSKAPIIEPISQRRLSPTVSPASIRSYDEKRPSFIEYPDRNPSSWEQLAGALKGWANAAGAWEEVTAKEEMAEGQNLYTQNKKDFDQFVKDNPQYQGWHPMLERGYKQAQLKEFGIQHKQFIENVYVNEGLANITEPEVALKRVSEASRQFLEEHGNFADYNEEDVAKYFGSYLQQNEQDVLVRHIGDRAREVEQRATDSLAALVKGELDMNLKNTGSWEAGITSAAKNIEVHRQGLMNNGLLATNANKTILTTIYGQASLAAEEGNTTKAEQLIALAHTIKTHEGAYLADTEYGVTLETQLNTALVNSDIKNMERANRRRELSAYNNVMANHAPNITPLTDLPQYINEHPELKYDYAAQDWLWKFQQQQREMAALPSTATREQSYAALEYERRIDMEAPNLNPAVLLQEMTADVYAGKLTPKDRDALQARLSSALKENSPFILFYKNSGGNQYEKILTDKFSDMNTDPALGEAVGNLYRNEIYTQWRAGGSSAAPAEMNKIIKDTANSIMEMSSEDIRNKSQNRLPESQDLFGGNTYDYYEMFPVLKAANMPPEHVAFVEREAVRQGIDPRYVFSVLAHESGGSQEAYNAEGNAIGYMQLTPSAIKDRGVVNPKYPLENIRGGIAHLAAAYNSFGGDLNLTTIAYHAGVQGTRDWLSGKPSGVKATTLAYRDKVLRDWAVSTYNDPVGSIRKEFGNLSHFYSLDEFSQIVGEYKNGKSNPMFDRIYQSYGKHALEEYLKDELQRLTTVTAQLREVGINVTKMSQQTLRE